MEHESDAIRLEVLELAGLRVEDVQLLSKRDQVKIRQLFALSAELAVEILSVGNELFDQVLNIHSKASIAVYLVTERQSTWVYYVLVLPMHSLGKTLGLTLL